MYNDDSGVEAGVGAEVEVEVEVEAGAEVVSGAQSEVDVKSLRLS